ncbi:MAG: hypothetical protein HFF37_01095, partial [Coprobacillus sp.]|nr:hypothetical protein [Coprobacillus sp.]
MVRLSQDKLNEIRQSVDIVDVIGQYLPLEKKGRNYIALCPFHDDKHPSMSVSPDKQIFMCFVCHTGGNVFTFLQEYLKISYIEAVKKVAEMGRIDLSEYHLDIEKRPVKRPPRGGSRFPWALLHQSCIYPRSLTAAAGYT